MTTQRIFKKMKIVYPAYSKFLFYFKQHISKFVFENNCVPLNPFMISEYFLLDTIDRDVIRNGNDNIVKLAEEIWVFGTVSDGVLAEIILAKKNNKPVKYFKVIKSKDIIEISKEEVEFEEDLEKYRKEL